MTDSFAPLEEPRADSAEKAVLGISMMSERAASEAVRALNASDFYEPAHQVIYTALERLVDERKPTDAISLWTQIEANGDDRLVRDGALYLTELFTMAPAAAALDHHISLVKEAGARRDLARLGTLSQSLASSKTSGTANSILETIRERLDSITASVVDSEIPTLDQGLEEALAEVDRLGREGAVVGIPTGFPELDARLNGLRPGQMVMVAGRPAMGKALAIDTPIPTPTGWTTMGALEPGDVVFGPDGEPTLVLAATNTMYDHECYEVRFSDGASIVADAEHLWVTTTRDERSTKPGPVTTREIRATLLAADGEWNHSIPCTQPLRLHGSSSAPPSAIPAGGCAQPASGVATLMRVGNPATMARITRTNIEQRQFALDGLLALLGESDAAVVSDAGLRDVICDLSASLGYQAVVAPAEAENAQETVKVVRPSHGRRLSRTIVAVSPVPSVPVRCIQVANDQRMYLAGRAMIPTHNSTIALDFARNAAFHHDKSVLFFSLEMSRLEVVMRCLSAQARVELGHLQTGKMSEEEWARVVRAHEKIVNARIGIDDSASTTIMDIRAKARGWQARFGLDLIVIDYLQLMNSHRRIESRQQEVSEISRNVKLIAKEFGIPVIALSQLNRGAEQRTDKRPMLSDLRESGSLEQDSDVVLLVHREEVYNPEQRVGEADIIIAKQRAGPTGTVPVVAQLHYSRFVPAAFSLGDKPVDTPGVQP